MDDRYTDLHSWVARLWLPYCIQAAEDMGMTLEEWGEMMDEVIAADEVWG